MLTGLSDAGWEVGVLQYASADNASICGTPHCTPWTAGDPALIRYFRLARSRRGPDLVSALITSIREWSPSLVLPDYRATAMVMVHTAMKLAPRAHASAAVAHVYHTLRCSLPRHTAHWKNYSSKLSVLNLASLLGTAKPPRATHLTPKQSRAMDAAELDRLALQLPLVTKTNADGQSSGVHICRTRADLNASITAAASAGRALRLEEFVAGAQADYVAVAVDGEVLGGYSYVTIAGSGQIGAGILFRTVNLPEAERHFAELVRAMGFTGVGQIDVRVDRKGRAFLVDPNMRLSPMVAIPPTLLGQGEGGGLLHALRMRIVDGPAARTQHAQRPLPFAVNILLACPGTTIGQLVAQAYCEDVFVFLPWPFARTLRENELGGAQFDEGKCTVRYPADPQGFELRQRCPLCPGRCLPLTHAASAIPADGATTVVPMCDQSLAWATNRTVCAPAQSGAHDSRRYRAPGGHGQGQRLTLCGGATMPGAPGG